MKKTSSTGKKIPVSLIVDDGAPVNPMHFLRPREEHVLTVPNSFTKEFAAVCRRRGIKGKFSVVPMISELGRIDRKLGHVSTAHLKGFIKIVKTEIMPRFDITPEILTHQAAYDIKNDTFRHVFEDEHIARSDAEEISEYVGLALKILDNAGLRPTGVTSPWMTGLTNEKNYAEGISRAFQRVLKKKFSWYFLHCVLDEPGKQPWITGGDPKTGRVVVTVPGNAAQDPFWFSQNPISSRQAKKNIRAGMDGFITADGKKGRLRELFDDGKPMTMVTHWQSLFSDGRGLGLEGLDELAGRINRIFGDKIEWLTCGEIAKTALP